MPTGLEDLLRHMPTGLEDLLRHMPTGLKDLLRHMPTGLEDLWATRNVKVRNSGFLYETSFDHMYYLLLFTTLAILERLCIRNIASNDPFEMLFSGRLAPWIKSCTQIGDRMSVSRPWI